LEWFVGPCAGKLAQQGLQLRMTPSSAASGTRTAVNSPARGWRPTGLTTASASRRHHVSSGLLRSAQLDAFEARFGLERPHGFRELYRWRNGQEEGRCESLHMKRMFSSLESVADS
jgi:hypothetical protein